MAPKPPNVRSAPAQPGRSSIIGSPREASMTDWQPSPRYPDPLVHVVDQSFARYKLNLAKVERLFTGCRWSEGPVWFGDLRCLLWSDIPNNRVLRWDDETATTTV